METLFGLFEGIGRHLWMVSWQVAVLAAMIAVVELTVRKASPLFRYGLWMIVLVRLCVPVTFTVPDSAERMVRGMFGIGIPTVDRLFATDTQDAVTWDRADGNSAAGGPASTVVTGPTLPVQRLWTRGAVTGFAWVLGFFALAAIIIIRMAAVMNKIRACEAITHDDLRDLVRRQCVSLGIGRDVVLRYGDAAGVTGPATVGVLRPAILLPRKIADSWSIDELEPVIVHELVHVRRRDLLVNWLQVAVQAAFWFHPAVWYANHRLRTIREQVCDDHAVDHLDGARELYGAGLLRAVETVGRDHTLGLVGLFLTERKSDVGRRIGRLMHRRYRAVSRMRVGAVMGLVLVAGLGLLLSCSGAKLTGRADIVKVVSSDLLIDTTSESLSPVLKKRIGEAVSGIYEDKFAFTGEIQLAAARIDGGAITPEIQEGLAGLAGGVERYTNIRIAPLEELSLDTSGRISAPFIYLSVVEGTPYTAKVRRTLKEYLLNGGFLYVEKEWTDPEDAGDADDTYFRTIMSDIGGSGVVFGVIPREHALNHCFFDFDDNPPDGCNHVRYPVIGAWLDGRLVALYSNNGYVYRWTERTAQGRFTYHHKYGSNILVCALLQKGSMVAGHDDELGYDIWNDEIYPRVQRNLNERQEQDNVVLIQSYIDSHPTGRHIPQALYSMGYAYHNLGKYVKAMELYQSVIERYPDSEYAGKALNVMAEAKSTKEYLEYESVYFEMEAAFERGDKEQAEILRIKLQQMPGKIESSTSNQPQSLNPVNFYSIVPPSVGERIQAKLLLSKSKNEAIKDGTVEVILDGVTLVAGRDYRMDYALGELLLISEEAMSPTANLEVHFETTDSDDAE